VWGGVFKDTALRIGMGVSTDDSERMKRKPFKLKKMENSFIKIEELEDGQIAIHMNGVIGSLSDMVASAIVKDDKFSHIMIVAMAKVVAYEQQKADEETLKSRLN
jgi:hypothetical protein